MSEKPQKYLGQELWQKMQEQQKEVDKQRQPDYLPLRLDTIVRLERAAAEFDIPLRDLLVAADNRELELLFEKPGGSVRVVLRPLKRNELLCGQPMSVRTPDYFVLRRENCEQLWDRPPAKIYSSLLGYRTGKHQTDLIELHANKADKNPLFSVEVDGKKHVSPDTKFGFWGSWEFWSDSVAFPLEIRPQDVFVRREEFKRWRFQVYYPRTKKVPTLEGKSDLPSPEHSMLREAKTPEDYRSPHLRWACDAAYIFWTDPEVVFDNKKTWPSETKIARWLMDQAPAYFPKLTPALHAARLTTPDWDKHLKELDEKKRKKKPL
ncbi:hypothetical protein FFI97_022375 [Variovorax sp. KBS0712]|uniref:hypothetical protein n=1 Tax=Variovorax sp. KBS0712 TaxID=2578111 RepID=UPI0011182069|nr:hypothetical protein [Variovorax sp. KBS0712]TSD56923.1 hypothetical protein FFI97_022375 [Variovorax sp. KBS0712]